MRLRTVSLALMAILAGLWIGLANSGAEPRTFVDAAGREVKLPETVNRVMAAGPPASILLYAVAPDKMVGWVRELTAEEKEFIAEPYRDLPAHGRLTGRASTANIEAVLAMKPDIILDVGSVDQTYASLADRVQEQTGIPYVLLDGSFANTAETLRKVGDLIGEEAAGAALASYSEAAIGRLDTAIAALPADERPRVYYGRGPKGLETGLAGSINMEVLSAVGATNVAEAAGSGGLTTVSVEQILAWKPEVILTPDRHFYDSVRNDPLWTGIPAVTNGRVYLAPTLPFGWFDAPPGINRVIGISWLAAVLYPDKVDTDLAEETRAFYKLFYHVDLDDRQLDTLLADAMTR
ncbi:MAG: iron ABC transporter substrate-binding protein [Pseudaminobacter sp.]